MNSLQARVRGQVHFTSGTNQHSMGIQSIHGSVAIPSLPQYFKCIEVHRHPVSPITPPSSPAGPRTTACSQREASSRRSINKQRNSVTKSVLFLFGSSRDPCAFASVPSASALGPETRGPIYHLETSLQVNTTEPLNTLEKIDWPDYGVKATHVTAHPLGKDCRFVSTTK